MKMIREMPKEGYKFYVKKSIPIKAIQVNEPFQVKTLEGTFTAKAGDYLIEGIKGELYTCDKKIFEESYQEMSKEALEEKRHKMRRLDKVILYFGSGLGIFLQWLTFHWVEVEIREPLGLMALMIFLSLILFLTGKIEEE